MENKNQPRQVLPKVVLLAYSKLNSDENPEKIVAAAAKLCYSNSNVSSILDDLTDENTSKFIKMLSSIGHGSPFEHISFTFGIEGISRTCSHQIVRHRIASYSQQSQRYVDLENSFSFIMPEQIRGNIKAEELYLSSISKDYDNYKNITLLLAQENLKNGMNKKDATKKALEDARFALPNACETKMVMTMNARSLMNFFRERCCNRAQWEIREVANQMLDLVLEVAPNIFSKAGAPCVYGSCKEGKMSCGDKQKPRVKQLEYNGK